MSSERYPSTIIIGALPGDSFPEALLTALIKRLLDQEKTVKLLLQPKMGIDLDLCYLVGRGLTFQSVAVFDVEPDSIDDPDLEEKWVTKLKETAQVTIFYMGCEHIPEYLAISQKTKCYLFTSDVTKIPDGITVEMEINSVPIFEGSERDIPTLVNMLAKKVTVQQGRM